MEQAPKPAEAAPKSKKTMYAIVGAVVIIVVVVLGLYFAGYLTPGSSAQVSIVDDNTCTPSGDAACKFTPASYAAHTGDTVTWKNNGGTTHTVTFPDPGFTSGGLTKDQSVPAGQSVSVTFSSAGNYHYYCTIHTWMKGNVTVS